MKRILLIFILALMGLVSSAQTTFDTRYNQALRYYQGGSYQDAISLLDAAIGGVGINESQKQKAEKLKRMCEAKLNSSTTASQRLYQVAIVSNPPSAEIVVNGEVGYAPAVKSFKPGKYAIHVEKEGYFPVDTTLAVTSQSLSSEKTFVVELKPQFSRLKLVTFSDEGILSTGYADMIIDGHSIRLGVESKLNYSERSKPKYFELYDDGTVPLPPSDYSIKVLINGFEPKDTVFNVGMGKTKVLNITLHRLKGYINFINGEGSQGAEVFIDGVSKGIMPLGKVEASVGSHIVSFKKNGHLQTTENNIVPVMEGQTTNVRADLKPGYYCQVSTTPESAILYINGEEAGITPLKITLIEGEQLLSFEKDGYWHGKEKINVGPSINGRDFNFVMVPTHPVEFVLSNSQEERYLNLWTLDGRFANTLRLPVTLMLPKKEIKYKYSVRNGRGLYLAKGEIVLDENDNSVKID